MNIPEHSANGYAIGRHMIADFNGCSYDAIATPDRVRDALLRAAEESGATVVSDSFRFFSPHGVSGFVIIAESHFSVHTWPEYSYAAIDIFTCGDTVNFNTAIRTLEAAFQAQRVEITADLFRGTGIGLAESNTAPLLAPPTLSWEHLFKESHAWGMTVDVELLKSEISDDEMLKQHCTAFAGSLGFPNLRAEMRSDCASDIELPFQFAGCFNGLQIRAYQKRGSDTLYVETLFAGFINPRDVGLYALEHFRAAGYRIRVSLRH